MASIEEHLEELWFGDTDADETEAVAARSRAAEVARAGLRPFPTSVARLMALLNSPDFNGAQVEEVLSSDPATAARVLQLANSSAFGGSGSCGSLRQAIVRLGARTISEMVVEVAIAHMYKDMSREGVAVQEHSAKVARAVKSLQRLHRIPGSWVVLAGLLHDVGKLLLLQSGEYSWASGAVGYGDSGVATERASLGFDHAILSAVAARMWGLPEPLPLVVGCHHDTARAFREGGDIATTVALLRVAEDLVELQDSPSPKHLSEVCSASHWAWLRLGPGDAVDSLDLLSDQGLVVIAGIDWREHIEASRERWKTKSRAL